MVTDLDLSLDLGSPEFGGGVIGDTELPAGEEFVGVVDLLTSA